jgi:hypothetical protein
VTAALASFAAAADEAAETGDRRGSTRRRGSCDARRALLTAADQLLGR